VAAAAAAQNGSSLTVAWCVALLAAFASVYTKQQQ